MGGGNKSLDDDEETSQPHSLVLEILGDFMKVPSARRSEVRVMARLKAAKSGPEVESRSPVTICAAIDKSSSMKDHLPLLKETLTFMVQQFRPSDRLSLISFDHEVTVDLPLTAMDADGKLKAEKAITKLRERGHTNLSGGLLAAMETLYRIKSSDASLVESVLLFTDGKANVGIRSNDALVKATKSFLDQINRQASVFTFGYGTEHDTQLLQGVAQAGNGLFYYIDNSDSIPESFCDCLGGLLSVAAQNIKLSFTAVGDAKISKPLTTYKVEEKKEEDKEEQLTTSYVVSIPDMYCEEERCILATVSLPPCPSLVDPISVPIVTCRVQFFDVLTNKLRDGEAWFSLVKNRHLEAPVPSDDCDDIELHQLRCTVATNLEKASVLAQGGDIAAARQLLDQDQQRLRRCRLLATKPLANHLLHTVNESLDGLEDTMVYMEHGHAVMANYACSHWQQRSSSTPSKAGYAKGKKFKKSAAPVATVSEPLTSTSFPVTSPYRNFVKTTLMAKHKSS